MFLCKLIMRNNIFFNKLNNQTGLVSPRPKLEVLWIWGLFCVSAFSRGWVIEINIYTGVCIRPLFFNSMTYAHECYISNLLSISIDVYGAASLTSVHALFSFFLPANCECFSVPLELVFGVNFASVRIIRFPSFCFPLVHISPVTMRNELRDTQVCHNVFFLNYKSCKFDYWQYGFNLQESGLVLAVNFFFFLCWFGILIMSKFFVLLDFKIICDSLLSFKSLF